MDKILEVKNLKVAFQNNLILDNLSFSLEKGETLGIIGPNGAGKTVLVKTILGLYSYKGEITWQEGIKIGYVPQSFYIGGDIPLTVWEFFKFKTKNFLEIYEVLTQVGWQKFDDIKKRENYFKKNLLNKQLGELSGGQLQRILVAWALLDNPSVLIFDEPTSGVDLGAENTIYATLSYLREKKGITIIFVSHELNIVQKYATKVLCLNKERVCYGEPQKALTNESLARLYGEEVNFYLHQH